MTRVADGLVSVVVPAFRHEGLVVEALRSVLAQDWEPLELIVIDDASPDGTADAIRGELARPEYAARFGGRVRFLVHEQNRGAHATINEGLALTRGAYLTILNSDDAYAPGRLRRLVQALHVEGGQLAFTAVRCVDAGGADVQHLDVEATRLHRAQADIARFPSVGFAALQQDVAISTGNLFFTRGLYARLGGFAPIAYCHDWDFLLRALLLTEPVYVPEPLYLYRFHPTNSFRALAHLAERETRQVLRRYFEAVRVGAEENPKAPSPRNWPQVFEYMLDRYTFHKFWAETAG